MKYSFKFFGKAIIYSGLGAMVYGLALIAMDVLLASKYGTGTQAAIYQVAYQVPTALIGALSGGVILGVVVPLFIQNGAPEHHPAAQLLLSHITGFVLFSLMVVTLLLMLFAPHIVTLIAFGFKPSLQLEVSTVLRWMLPMLILHGLASIATAGLLALNRVALANLLPALVPLAGIATIPFWGNHGARWIAWGYLAGITTVAGVLITHLHVIGYRILPPIWPNRQVSKQLASIFGTSVVAYLILSIILPINLAFAGRLSTQDLAVFAYGSKLVLLALAFLTTIINSVGLPYFSGLAQNGSTTSIWLKIRYIVCCVFIFGIGLVLIWQAVAYWLIKLIYTHGQFSLEDAKAVAEVQRVLILQIPFYMVAIVCWRALNSLVLWRPLIWASIVAIMVDLIAIELMKDYHARGIASAYTIAIVVWSLALLFALRYHITTTEN